MTAFEIIHTLRWSLAFMRTDGAESGSKRHQRPDCDIPGEQITAYSRVDVVCRGRKLLAMGK